MVSIFFSFFFFQIPSDSVTIISQEQEEETGSPELSGQTENIVREYFCIKTFLVSFSNFILQEGENDVSVQVSFNLFLYEYIRFIRVYMGKINNQLTPIVLAEIE